MALHPLHTHPCKDRGQGHRGHPLSPSPLILQQGYSSAIVRSQPSRDPGQAFGRLPSPTCCPHLPLCPLWPDGGGVQLHAGSPRCENPCSQLYLRSLAVASQQVHPATTAGGPEPILPPVVTSTCDQRHHPQAFSASPPPAPFLPPEEPLDRPLNAAGAHSDHRGDLGGWRSLA